MIEKRGEPRFPVTSPIRVVVPGEGGHTMDSTLIDISGTGMRFLAPESMEAEDVVGIEVDSRLILAEVRYCQPRGARFVVGARRLHEIAKDAQLANAPAVVSEMLGHLRRHLAAGDTVDSHGLAVEALEKIVERVEHPEEVPTPDPEITSSQPQSEPAPGVELLNEENVEPEAKSVAPSQPEPEPVSTESEPKPTDPEPRWRNAQNANRLVAARSASKKMRTALLLVASLVLAAVLGYFLYPRQSDAKPTVPAAMPIRIVDSPPELRVHHAQVRVLKPTSLSLAIDGADPFKSSFQTNDTRAFDFSKGATLRLADGAAVEITIDGNSVGPIKPGPQAVQINPSGVELVK